jgi:hypothetical protein
LVFGGDPVGDASVRQHLHSGIHVLIGVPTVFRNPDVNLWMLGEELNHPPPGGAAASPIAIADEPHLAKISNERVEDLVPDRVGEEFSSHGLRAPNVVGLAELSDRGGRLQRHVASCQWVARETAMGAGLGASASDPDGGLEARIPVAGVFSTARLAVAVFLPTTGRINADIAAGTHFWHVFSAQPSWL